MKPPAFRDVPPPRDRKLFLMESRGIFAASPIGAILFGYNDEDSSADVEVVLDACKVLRGF